MELLLIFITSVKSFSHFTDKSSPCESGFLPQHHEQSKGQLRPSLMSVKQVEFSGYSELRMVDIIISVDHDFRGFMIRAYSGDQSIGSFSTKNGTSWNCSVVTHSDKNFKSKIEATWKGPKTGII